MKQAYLISGLTTPQNLIQRLSLAGISITEVLTPAGNHLEKDQFPVSNSFVFLDAGLPLMLLHDLREQHANIILFISEKDELVFTSLNGLFGETYRSEVLNILETLNGKQNNEMFLKTLQPEPDKIVLSTANDIVFIETAHIRYFEAQSNYTNIYTDLDKKYTSSRNIGFYEKLLGESMFFRCHHSYLVNLSKVTRFIKGHIMGIELDYEKVIDVSVRKKEKMLELLGVTFYT